MARGLLSLVAGFALLVLLSACSKVQTPPLDLTGEMAKIFSNRPQTQTHAVVLIKLKSPALLSSLKAQGAEFVIDPQLAEAIAREQEQVRQRLLGVSEQIQIVYKYRMVLNGLAVAVPIALIDQVERLPGIHSVKTARLFSRLKTQSEEPEQERFENLKIRNSVQFIGGFEAHARQIRGQGMKVGVIDTGIDYTHALLGGSGHGADFKAIDPAQAFAGFPTAKVAGGIDLVGSDYDSGAEDTRFRIPKPDLNPLDESGHGTHVAGTVAGIGDGVISHDGVAPDALLYAIKVFGKDGSTSDTAVIAGLEYAADPDGDGRLGDRLHVVNLSLGGGYGTEYSYYTEAVRNLTRSGTVVVASAGNSGDADYIVGSPSVADEAISVASSVDDRDGNWKFRAVKFVTSENPQILAEAVEGAITKPIEKSGTVSGDLVYVGLADRDFDDEVVAQIRSRVALIDRGGVPFTEKIERAAKAGAIGVVMVNNQSGPAIPMGGEGAKIEIPGVMITKELGETLKDAILKGGARIEFQTDLKYEKPELIDTISDFSSKGPRSFDALIKPEITAPGTKIISAAMGGGAKTVALSGTSMAGPHIAGVMALLRQVHPELSPNDLKGLVMGTAKTLNLPSGGAYSVSRQGAGRVQVIKALEAPLLALPSAISLGELVIENQKTLARTVNLKNVSQSRQKVDLVLDTIYPFKMHGPSMIELEPGQSVTVPLKFTLRAPKDALTSEIDGLVKMSSNGQEILRIPVLAVVSKVSRIKADRLVIRASSEADAQGSVSELSLVNQGANTGDAYPFNLIASGARKADPKADLSQSRICDLEAAGYRLLNKNGVAVLQFAIKIFEPVSTWDHCDVSVLIDADQDGIEDQELVGTRQNSLAGLSNSDFASLLLNADEARRIRRQFEIDAIAKKPDVKEDYTSAVVSVRPMIQFPQATMALIEVAVSDLKLRPSADLAVRIATSAGGSNTVEPDDFLEKDAKKWTAISVMKTGAAYVDLPEKINLTPGSATTVEFTKGAGNEELWVLYPQNKPVRGSGVISDAQSEIVRPRFEVEP